MSAGRRHTAAIRSDGTLWAWGLGTFSRLGDGTTSRRTSPVQISTYTYKDIATGRHHSAAIRSDGTLWTWGRNNYAQLGDGTVEYRLSPVKIFDVSRR